VGYKGVVSGSAGAVNLEVYSGVKEVKIEHEDGSFESKTVSDERWKSADYAAEEADY